MENDGGNGTKRMVYQHEGKIDALMAGQEMLLSIAKDTNETMKAYFGPTGVCPETRARIANDHNENASAISNIKTHIKGLWAVFTFVAVSIIGIIIDIVIGGRGK